MSYITPAYNGLPNIEFRNVHLLPNGKILLGCSSQTWIIDPTPDGTYHDGTARRVSDPPYTHTYGPSSMLNDGRIMFHAGEYGTSYQGKTSIFNPWTETWSSVEDTISRHSASWVDDVGNIYGTLGVADYGVLPYQIYKLPPNGNFAEKTIIGGDLGTTIAEAGPFLLPDGRVAWFTQFAGNVREVRSFRPNYDSETVSDGSFPGDNLVTSAIATIPNSNHFLGNTLANTWRSYGTIIYEVGPTFYMPKIGKPVVLGGNGMIYTYDFNTNELSRVASMGMTPLNMPSTHRPKIAGFITTFGGYYANDMAPTFSFSTIGGDYSTSDLLSILNNMAQKFVWIRLTNNTQFAKYAFTSASSDAQNNIILTGVVETIASGLVRLTSGDQVVLANPHLDTRDCPGAFLPNGDILFLAGYTSVYGRGDDFRYNSRLMKWDGVSSLAEDANTSYTTTDLSILNYTSQMIPLPDGSVFVKGSTPPDFRFYIPTTNELTPLNNSIPNILSISPNVKPGSTIRVTGTQLNGLTEGAYYGDDGTPRTNFPIFSFRNLQTNTITYANTKQLFYRGIQASRLSDVDVEIPNSLPVGSYEVRAIASGVPSNPVTIFVRSGTSSSIIMI